MVFYHLVRVLPKEKKDAREKAFWIKFFPPSWFSIFLTLKFFFTMHFSFLIHYFTFSWISPLNSTKFGIGKHFFWKMSFKSFLGKKISTFWVSIFLSHFSYFKIFLTIHFLFSHVNLHSLEFLLQIPLILTLESTFASKSQFLHVAEEYVFILTIIFLFSSYSHF